MDCRKGLGVLGLQAVPTLRSRRTLPISHFYLTGSKGDGNGNSRAQPRQGTDLNGRSLSPSVRNQSQRTTQSSKLCLSSKNVLHTTHPFPGLSWVPVKAHRGPWQAHPPSMPHGQDAQGWWHCQAPAHPSAGILLPWSWSSVGLQVHAALTFHSQLRQGKFSAPSCSGCS